MEDLKSLVPKIIKYKDKLDLTIKTFISWIPTDKNFIEKRSLNKIEEIIKKSNVYFLSKFLIHHPMEK